jgi:hypothetical protein
MKQYIGIWFFLCNYLQLLTKAGAEGTHFLCNYLQLLTKTGAEGTHLLSHLKQTD